jgi:NAD(P)-dependent dehydrogenase (short-subunit alcohol dehydrogenase family)
MPFGLDDKVAIVTGPGGFGAAYCRGLSDAGARVVIADREESGEATVDALRREGHEPLLVPTDVTSEASTLEMAKVVADTFGGADVLVNNAGMFQGLPHPPPDPLEKMPLELWDRVLAMNLTSTLLATRAVVPLMRARGGGVIVNQTSPAIWQNPPGRIHYAVSKGAILPMTRSLARELASDNIRVNAICPGPVVTGDEGELSAEVVRGFIERRCIKRFGSEADIVGPLLFLASEMSSWITGQVLVVDGGGCMLG